MNDWTEVPSLSHRAVSRQDIVRVKGKQGEWDVLRIQSKDGQEILELRNRNTLRTRIVTPEKITTARRLPAR